jgi:predicted PurR-regulated permease PerM
MSQTKDRVAEFFREPTAKRALTLTLFLAGLFLFRKLFITLIFFVVFERGVTLACTWLMNRFKWSKGLAFGVTLAAFASVAVSVTWASAGRVAKVVMETRATLPQRLASIKENELFLAIKDHLPDADSLVERASHYGEELARFSAELGHLAISFVIGLILAIIFFFDKDRVLEFRNALPKTSIFSTLLRWFEYVAEAVSLMVQVQLIVALCNALLTLPVLLMLSVPHVPALLLLIFFAGLIPVVGNLISGAVLILVSFQARGIPGVVIFVGLTFVLHKIESYYLNPRLTSRHVKLPNFLLIISLVAWEHLLGIPGLFLSFPILFVAGNLIREFQSEDAAAVTASTVEPG